MKIRSGTCKVRPDYCRVWHGNGQNGHYRPLTSRNVHKTVIKSPKKWVSETSPLKTSTKLCQNGGKMVKTLAKTPHKNGKGVGNLEKFNVKTDHSTGFTDLNSHLTACPPLGGQPRIRHFRPESGTRCTDVHGFTIKDSKKHHSSEAGLRPTLRLYQ